MKVIETIQKYLEKININPEATLVYAKLVELGPSSAQQVAKPLGLSRTQTYRRLEELQHNGLVSTEQLSYGTLFRALPLENIDGLIANRESETQALRRNLSSMANALQALTGSSGPTASVRHYYGIAGLKQVNWNLTKADKEYWVFESAHLSAHLDKAFTRRCRERYIENKLTSYDLTNATKASAQEMEPYEASHTFIRHIDPKILTINFELYLYNQTVTLLDYDADKPHAIEIDHPALFSMMKQLFDAIWAMGTDISVK